MECTFAAPGEYDKIISATAAMRAVATIIVATYFFVLSYPQHMVRSEINYI